MPFLFPGFPSGSYPSTDDTTKEFNLYGYMLYDELDDEIISFMSEHADMIDIMAGDKCYIVYFEHPNLTDDLWVEKVKNAFGEKADEYLKEWENIKPSDRNRSHQIADKLLIPSNMFPSIIFLKDLNAKECTRPYPLIDDNKFYRDLFSLINKESKNDGLTLEELDKKMGNIKAKWFIPKYIEDRAEIFERYSNPVLKLAKPFISFIK